MPGTATTGSARCQTDAVAEPAADASYPPALARARELLSPGAATEAGGPPQADAGYLDLLAGRTVASTGRAQDLMLSGTLPRIYERHWRPALGRVAKGPRGPSMEGEYRLARELLELRPGGAATVVDVACGTGNFTRELAPIAGSRGLVVGIDVSETMLARAVEDTQRAGLRNVAYVRGDAEALPFVDGAFEAVCCFAALHLFSDPMRALDRIRAVLRPGGRVAILTSVRRGPAPLARLEAAVGALTGMRVFAADELRGALEARGFVHVEQRMAGVTQTFAATRA
jgi:SAM-dependent methyltransferase